MKVSIIVTTVRKEPRIDWLVDGLAAQALPSDEIELVVIDLLGRSRAELGITLVPAIKHVVISEPKPTIWQGRHRIPKVDWWGKSGALNTALVLARHDYIAALDDRARIGPKWLPTVRNGCRELRVLAGAYEKHEDGKITKDARLEMRPDGMLSCGGHWFFGCTFALPLAWALGVNGFEEGLDGMSFEDVIFGKMLENGGRRIDFVPGLFVAQERSAAHANPMRRTDKGVSPNDKSHAALARFGTRTRTELTPDLRALRASIRAGKPFPMPDPTVEYRDWYDGQLVRDMT